MLPDRIAATPIPGHGIYLVAVENFLNLQIKIQHSLPVTVDSTPCFSPPLIPPAGEASRVERRLSLIVFRSAYQSTPDLIT
jgi:hypothetical protein